MRADRAAADEMAHHAYRSGIRALTVSVRAGQLQSGPDGNERVHNSRTAVLCGFTQALSPPAAPS